MRARVATLQRRSGALRQRLADSGGRGPGNTDSVRPAPATPSRSATRTALSDSDWARPAVEPAVSDRLLWMQDRQIRRMIYASLRLG